MYLLYRIKDNSRFLPEFIAGGLFHTLKEANDHKKPGWSVKKVKVIE